MELPRLTSMLTWTVVGTYFIVALGATLLAASWLGAVTDLGLLYAVTSTVLGGVFVWTVVRQYRVDSDRAAFRSFHASNAYLGCLLVAVILETLAL